MDKKELAGFIDHTLLKSDATAEQIRQLCQEAMECGFCSVSVNPRWVGFAADVLAGSGVKVGGVVSLPLGGDVSKIKAAQAREAILAGADEIDMVADLASIMCGDRRYLAGELKAVVKVCHSMRPKVLLKVIIESAALNDEQKIFACQMCSEAGVDFVKTSTGMHPNGGASVEDVKLMKEYAVNCKVKAAGGIRDAERAMAMLEAGAERIGTSAGVKIINEFGAGQGQ